MLPVSYPLRVDWGVGRIDVLKENEPTVSLQAGQDFLHREHCYESTLARRKTGDGATRLHSVVSRP